MKAKLLKQQLYYWEGKDSQGVVVEGELLASSLTLARANLLRRGIVSLRIKKKRSGWFSEKSIKSADITIFTRQLATMLGAGIPLIQAFQILIEGLSNHPLLKQLLSAIEVDVEAGCPFATALGKYPRHFDNLYCGLVAAGEQSGSLDSMLTRLTTYLEKTQSLKNKVKKAMYYPAIIILVAFIVCTILLVFAVPQFEQVFKSVGAGLPLFTQLVINVSHFFGKYWWLIVPGLVGLPFAIYYQKKRSPRFSNFLDKFSLKIPILGKILQKEITARTARTLATLFAAGVPLVDAFEGVALATGNHEYEKAVLCIRDEVAKGGKIHHAARTTGRFPNMMVQMVAIGEESGTLDGMLNKAAVIYEEEVDTLVEGLSSLLEPVIIVVLGIFVGSLVVAMYLPIFKLGSVF